MQPNKPDEQQPNSNANQVYQPPQQSNPSASMDDSEPTTIQPQQQPNVIQNPAQPIQPAQPEYPPTTTQPLSNSFATTSPKTSRFTPKKVIIIVSVVLLIFIAGFALLKLGSKAVNVVTTGSFSGGVSLEDYTSQEFGFSIKAPEGWPPEVSNESFFQQVRFIEPVGDVSDTSEANSNYATLRIEQEDNSEREFSQKEETEYFDDIKKRLQRGLTEQDTTSTDRQIAELESEELTTINGNSAYKVKLKISNFNYDEGAVGYEYYTYVYIDKIKQYEITLSAHESEKPVLSVADEIINSFKIN